MIFIYSTNRKARLELRKTRKFKSTNKIWNDLSLNRSWSIGYLTKIFKEFSGTTYEEWEDYYFLLGQERLNKIKELPLEKQSLLKSFNLQASNRFEDLYILDNEDKNLNSYYGRTKEELKTIGSFMYQELCKQGNHLEIKEEECIIFVFIRVLDEIFIGMDREINTIKKLQKAFPKVEFRELSVEDDSNYAVDYELYVNGELRLAIQIKSNHYKVDNQQILQKTKSYNKKKNELYTRKYGIDVLTIYSNENGYLEDRKTLPTIYSYVREKKLA